LVVANSKKISDPITQTSTARKGNSDTDCSLPDDLRAMASCQRGDEGDCVRFNPAKTRDQTDLANSAIENSTSEFCGSAHMPEVNDDRMVPSQ
jgi:hypothetical protein